MLNFNLQYKRSLTCLSHRHRLLYYAYFSGSQLASGWRVIAPGRLYSGSTPARLVLFRLSSAQGGALSPQVGSTRLYSGSTRTFPAQLASGWRVVAPGRLYSGSTPALLRLYSGSTRTFPAQLNSVWRVIAPGRLYSGSTPALLRLSAYFSGSIRLRVARYRLRAPAGSTPALHRFYSYFSGSARLSVARHRPRPALLRLYSYFSGSTPLSSQHSGWRVIAPPGRPSLRSAHSLPDQTQRSA